ncbi:MAG: glycogen/starch/alpha-glucan phosphorylase, partial [Eubacteriales bacterium]
DFCSYTDACNRVNTLFLDRKRWNKMSLVNTASSGIFSSDRTIKEYSDDIWKSKYRDNF